MAKQRLVRRHGVEVVMPAQESRLVCPLCGCGTLNRDTAPAADGWYIEWCSGGVIHYRDVDEGIDYEFECPYAEAGFKE